MTDLFRKYPYGFDVFTMFQPWKHNDAAICLNCRYWTHLYPESDGRSGGRCRRLSGDKWRYDVIPLSGDRPLDLITRCDFGCNQFSRKPPATGRAEPELEDTP